MKNLKTKILGLLLAALVASFFMGKAFFRKSHEFNQMSLVCEDDFSKITGIVIKKADNSIEIVNMGNVWFCKKDNQYFPASTQKIISFFSKLVEKRSYSLYSTDSSSFNRYSLGEKDCFQLILKNGERLHSKIDLGDKDFSHSFVFFRKAGDSNIYKMFYDFENFITTDPSFWNDPSLFFENPLGKQKISKFVANVDSKVMTIQNGSVDKDGLDVFEKMKSLRHGSLLTSIEGISLSDDFLRSGAKPEISVRVFYESDFMDVAFIKISEDLYLINYSAMDGAFSCSFTLSRWSFVHLRTIILSAVK